MLKQCPVCQSTKFWYNQIDKYWQCKRCKYTNDPRLTDDFVVYRRGGK